MTDLKQTLRLAAAACMLVALSAPWPALAQGEGTEPQVQITQVDESKFPQVTVYVSVTDAAGEPLGIAPDRLALAENGAPVEIDHVGGEGEVGPLTTLLVVDVSGSMNEGGKLAAAQAAARAYVEQMRPGDRAGLFTFNTAINAVQPATTDREALLTAIDGLKAFGDTTLYDALVQAAQTLGDVPGRKAIIALTDGLDNRSMHTPDQVLEQIGPGGLSISVVGLGDPSQLGVTNSGLDEAALRALAGRAGGEYGYAADPEALTGLYERYGRALQSEYALTYTSPTTLRDGVNRTLTVTLGEASAVVQADYNPGGVLPEVSRTASWPLFGAILAVLLALLLVPAVAARALAWAGNLRAGRGRKEVRIRLHDQPQPRVRLR
jgi:VWFA-related protein